MYSEGLNEVGVRERELLQRCSEELMDIKAGTPEAAERTAKEFVDHCRGRSWIFSDAGASDKEDRRFCFTHRTFLQYFAARKLARALRSGRASNKLIDLIPEDTGDPFQALLTLQVLGTEADKFLVNLLNVQDELVASWSSFLAEIVRTVDLHDRTARVCCEVICEDIFQEAVLKADNLLEISLAVSLPDFVSSERLANLVTCREENLPGVLDALRTIYSEELQLFFTSSDVFPLVSIRDSAKLGAETLTRERSDDYREVVDSLMNQLRDDIGHVTEDVSLAAAIVVAGLTPMGHVATRWGGQLLRLSLDPGQGKTCLTVLFDSIINRAHFELWILPALAILQDCLASPMPLNFNRREAEAMLYGLDIGGQPHDVLSLGREDYRFDDQVGPATIASVLGVAVGLARELGTGYGLDWLKACARESFSEIELEEAIEINPSDPRVEAFDPWGSRASEAFHLALGRVRVRES